MGLAELLDRKLASGGEVGGISIVEVSMRPAEVFVRPLLHDEAIRLKRLSKRAMHQCTRQRLLRDLFGVGRGPQRPIGHAVGHREQPGKGRLEGAD